MAVKPKKPDGRGRSRSPAKVAAARANGRKRKPRPRWDYTTATADVAPDTLEIVHRTVSLIRIMIDEIVADQRMAPERKRQELRATFKALAALVPKARLREAEQAVRGEREAMEQVTADPPVVPRPANGGHGPR